MKIGVFFVFAFLCVSVNSVLGLAKEVDLRERILQAKPGEWVRVKSSGNLETTTLISKKESDFLTIEIHTTRKEKPQSWVEQVYRLKDKAIVRCRVKYPDGTIDDVAVDQVSLWVDIFKNNAYRFVAQEKVKVPSGVFQADHYRTVVQDNLVHLWLSEKVPVTGLVKSRFRGGSTQLIGYGDKGVSAVFP